MRSRHSVELSLPTLCREEEVKVPTSVSSLMSRLFIFLQQPKARPSLGICITARNTKLKVKPFFRK